MILHGLSRVLLVMLLCTDNTPISNDKKASGGDTIQGPAAARSLLNKTVEAESAIGKEVG